MAKVQKLQVTAPNFPISITLQWDLFLPPLVPVEVPPWLLLLTEAGLGFFDQNISAGLVIAQPPSIFEVPPRLSPAILLDSLNFSLFSPTQFELQGSHLCWENLCLPVRAGTSSLGCGTDLKVPPTVGALPRIPRG
ncbi:hypothetical protein WN944_022557 [Citrus x changshan-huyou]|uniref:Uncharacterized protein n=1 Tax=Citrus x changshan-huyou TaxID=2935761 RepID=A0AAP0N4P5_9ROSI